MTDHYQSSAGSVHAPWRTDFDNAPSPCIGWCTPPAGDVVRQIWRHPQVKGLWSALGVSQDVKAWQPMPSIIPDAAQGSPNPDRVAIEFAVQEISDDSERLEFLECWLHGRHINQWPEFLARAAQPPVARTEEELVEQAHAFAQKLSGKPPAVGPAGATFGGFEPLGGSHSSADSVDAARYRRLRVLGVAPAYTDHLKNGNVMRFTNLDEFVDKDLAWTPSRGEAGRDVPQAAQELRDWQDSSEFYRKDLKDLFDAASDLYAAFVQVKNPTNGQNEALANYAIVSNELVRRDRASSLVTRPESKTGKVCGYHDGCPQDGPVCHLCEHLQPTERGTE